MNLNMQALPSAMLNPPTPPAPPSDQEQNEIEQANKQAIAQHQAFEQMLAAELSKKSHQQTDPATPWVMSQFQPYVPPQSEDDQQEIAAAEAMQAAGKAAAGLRARTMPLKPVATPGASDELEVAKVDALKERESKDHAPIVVEAGLPPVQPREPLKHDEPVPIADFPQVINAQITQMVKNDQPITQLDLQISPPQIGPVNLQVSLENGAVNVQLVALTMQAKQSLENHVGAIQQILQAHSFQPGEIRVVTAAAGRAGAGASGKNGEQPGMGFGQGGKKRSGGPNDLTVGAS